MLKINKNTEIEEIKGIKEYMKKTFKEFKSITSEEIKNEMIIMTGISKKGKSYEIYYNMEVGYLRVIFDGWNNTMEHGIWF